MLRVCLLTTALLLPVSAYGQGTAFPQTASYNQSLLRNLSPAEVEMLLRSAGYSDAVVFSDSEVLLPVDGFNVLVKIFGDGDLQLYFGVADANVSMAQVNEWNRKKRLSRAYIDDAGDPILEADLLADQGITREQFLNFVKVFRNSAIGFRRHVSQ